MSTLGKIITVLVVLFLGLVGYQFVKKDTKVATSDNAILEENFDGGSGENQEFLRVLKNLQNVSLDGSILSSEVFTSLVDFSVELKDEPAGRQNPFRPINPNEPALVAAGVGTTTFPLATTSAR